MCIDADREQVWLEGDAAVLYPAATRVWRRLPPWPAVQSYLTDGDATALRQWLQEAATPGAMPASVYLELTLAGHAVLLRPSPEDEPRVGAEIAVWRDAGVEGGIAHVSLDADWVRIQPVLAQLRDACDARVRDAIYVRCRHPRFSEVPLEWVPPSAAPPRETPGGRA